MKNLVTGATGFIGKRLLARLRAQGEDCRALCRSEIPDQDAILADLADQAALARACAEIDCVYHCAGYAHAFSASDPNAHWHINYEGTQNLLRAAVEAGVTRFVFLSSVKAMADPREDCADEDWPGDPSTPYGRAKLAAENAVLEIGAKYGVHVVILRLAMVYGRGGRGNLERMANGIRAGWFPPLPETGNRRSLVHVEDVITAMILTMRMPVANGKTYIVADSKQYSGREIYDTVRNALGMPPASWEVPEVLLRAGGTMGDIMGKLTGRSFPLNSEVTDRLLGSSCYNTARIEQDLGWKACISLDEGVREMCSQNSVGIISPNLP